MVANISDKTRKTRCEASGGVQEHTILLTTQTRLTKVQKTDRFAGRLVQAAVPYDNQQWQTGLSHVWRGGSPQMTPLCRDSSPSDTAPSQQSPRTSPTTIHPASDGWQ